MVIGSNSFSGASFIRCLLDHGIAVTAVSRSAEYPRCYLPYRWQTNENVAFHQLDLNQGTAAIVQLIKERRITHIINFAAMGMVAESWLYPVDYYTTNVVANVKLHEELRKIPHIERYVHISTPEVYGNTEGMVMEDAPLNPSTPYAVSRAACDLHLRSLHENYGFPVVWTRAANVYGPGQQPYRILPRTVLCAKLGMRLKLHGGGQSVRSFIHIRDVAAATYRIATAGKIGSVYHLSTERFISIAELVGLICAQLGITATDIVDIAEERPGKDHAYFLESSRIRQELGWSDSIRLEDGIRETIEWVDRWLPDIRQHPLDYQHKA